METIEFTARVEAIGDDVLRELQIFLGEHPEAGDVIQGTGGMRKVRVKLPGRGKSSGARAIYLHLPGISCIVLIYLYTKSRQTDLSPAEKNSLRKVSEFLKANQHFIP